MNSNARFGLFFIATASDPLSKKLTRNGVVNSPNIAALSIFWTGTSEGVAIRGIDADGRKMRCVETAGIMKEERVGVQAGTAEDGRWNIRRGSCGNEKVLPSIENCSEGFHV